MPNHCHLHSSLKRFLDLRAFVKSRGMIVSFLSFFNGSWKDRGPNFDDHFCHIFLFAIISKEIFEHLKKFKPIGKTSMEEQHSELFIRL